MASYRQSPSGAEPLPLAARVHARIGDPNYHLEPGPKTLRLGKTRKLLVRATVGAARRPNPPPVNATSSWRSQARN